MNKFLSPEPSNFFDFSNSINETFTPVVNVEFPLMSHYRNVIVLSQTATHLHVHCPVQGNFFIERNWQLDWFLQTEMEYRNEAIYKMQLFK